MTITEKQWAAAFSSAFMQPHIEHGTYYTVDTTSGTETVPTDVAGTATTPKDLMDFLEGKPQDPDEVLEVQTGWLARMSASGYMDCTDWTAHETEQEAMEYLVEMYGDDEGDDS